MLQHTRDFVLIAVAIVVAMLTVFGVGALIQHDQAIAKQLDAKANIVDVARALNEIVARLPQPTPATK